MNQLLNTLSKRQIIVLGAFALPVIGLIVLSDLNPSNVPPPKLLQNRLNATNKPQANAQAAAGLQQARANMQARLKEAEATTMLQYSIMLKNDPLLPPNVETYRSRIRLRIQQLEKITPEQWAAEEHQRAEILRARPPRPAPAAQHPAVQAVPSPAPR